MRILVIDDESQMLRIVRRFLGQSCEVVTVECASDAFLALARCDPFDVILCDVHLPGMGGATFLSRLSPLDASRVVFMTGGACMPGDERLFEERPTLLKPFTKSELFDVLEGAAHAAA